MKKRMVIIFATAVILCTGCAKKQQEDVSINKSGYVRNQHPTETVMCGDIKPHTKAVVIKSKNNYHNYTISDTELVLDKVWVKAGDHVKKGDLLVSFKSDTMSEAKKNYQDSIAENNIEIEHYKRLMEIDPTVNCKDIIAELEENNKLNNLYIEEIDARLKHYQIYAKDDGVITVVNDNLSKGYFTSGMTLLSQNFNSAKYSALVSTDFKIKKGDIYTAHAGNVPYEFRVVYVDDNTDDSGESIRRIEFEPVSDTSSIGDKDIIEMEFTGDVVKNALYVPENTVDKVEVGKSYKYFAYVADDNGYLEPREIKIARKVGNLYIIKTGLSEGEKVAIR